MKDTEAEVTTNTQDPEAGSAMQVKRPKPPSAEYYEECRKALEDPGSPGRTFLESIGLKPETALHAGIGYDPEWTSSAAKPPEPYLIIPVRPSKYQTYNLGSEDRRWKGYGQHRPWNIGMMFAPGVHFIASGVFDALALIEEGWPATAMLGGYNDQLFLDQLEERDWKPDPESVYIVALGSAPGETAVAEWLTEKLAEKGATVLSVDLAGESGRVYEAHKADRDKFREQVRTAVEAAAAQAGEHGQKIPEQYLEPSGTLPPVSMARPHKVRRITDAATIGKPSPRFGMPISKRDYRAKTQQALQQADDALREKIEQNGISLETLVARGFGYDPDLAHADRPDVVPILLPLQGEGMAQLDWGVEGITLHEPLEAEAWNLPAMKQKGVVFITRDLWDGLVAMENGQTTVVLTNGAEPFLHWIDKTAKYISRGTVFVIALGGSEEDVRDADAILQKLKSANRIASRAAIRGQSDTIAEDYRENPDLVRKRFALAVKKCSTVLETRAKQEAARKARSRKGAKGKGKGRPQPGGRRG